MRKEKRPPNEAVMDILTDLESAVSVYEMTGMLPRPPLDEAEAESYQNVLDYTPEPVKKDCLY